MRFFIKKTQGFTLVELLVVLSILGLVTAVALPNLNRAMDTIQARLNGDKVRDAINELPLAAKLNRRNLLLAEQMPEDEKDYISALDYLSLDNGWSVKSQGIRYRSTGVCEGGELNIYYNSELLWSGKLSMPYCQIPLEAF